MEVAQGKRQIEFYQSIKRESNLMRKLKNKRRGAIRSADVVSLNEAMVSTCNYLNNGFGIPISSVELSICKFQGKIYMQTDQGNFREFYILLLNNELFVYTSRES